MYTEIMHEGQMQSAQQTTKEVSESGKGLARRIKGPVKWFFIWVIATLCYAPIYMAWWIASQVVDYGVFSPISEFISASSSTFAAIASLAVLALLFSSYYYVMTPVLLSRFGINFSKGWIIRFIPVHLLSYSIVVFAFDFLLVGIYSPGNYIFGDGEGADLMFVAAIVLRIAVFFIALVVALLSTLKLSVMRACQVSTACVGMHICSFIAVPILKHWFAQAALFIQ